MKFLFRKDRELAAIVAILFAVTSVIFGIVLPAHALPTPIVENTARGTWASGFTYTITLTVAFAGDAIAVLGGVIGTTAGTTPVISSVTSPSVSGNPLSNSLWFNQAQSFHCVGDVAFCSGVGTTQTGVESYSYGTATTAGSITLTINLSANANIASEAEAYDIAFSSTNPSGVTVNSCDATKTGDCGNPVLGGITSGPNDILLIGASSYGASYASATTNNGSCNFIGSGATKFGGAWLTGAGTCGLNYNGNSGANSGFAIITVDYGATVVTSTTTVNTVCLGSCGNQGSNGTSTFSIVMPDRFIFQTSQNLPEAATVDNFTMKVSSVHITTSTGIAYILVYTAVGTPNGGNPYTLVKQIPITITNNTSNFFIHYNPQANICPSCYYAVGIMPVTTASRGSGASGSGISFFETSANVLQYSFDVGSPTPPTNFFSDTVLKPNLFMYVHLTFFVTLLTSTTTRTVVSGASTTITTTTTTCVGCTATTTVTTTTPGTSTVTTTSTSTSTLVVNQGDPTKPTFWYLPMFFILFFTAIFLGAYAMVNAATRGRLR